MYFCGKSDVGMRRQINQDSFRAIRIWGGDAVLLVVCDGMGGHKAGEVASQTAIEAFCNSVIAKPCLEEDLAKSIEFIRYQMVDAATKANDIVYHLSREHAEYYGMGTTLVAAILFKGCLYSINIGDSRLYTVTRNKVKQITKDHSFVQYLIDNGKLTPEEAKYYPRKNVITRAVGVSEKIDMDFFHIPLYPSDGGYILLCSDGLSNYADDKILGDILYGSMNSIRPSEEKRLEKKAEMLIAYANAKGGSDNITAVLATF